MTATTETNTQRVLRVLLSPCAQAEAVGQAVLHAFDLETAVGAQLDILGARVGRARQGETDDEIYRAYIRSQITANRSNGTINTILKVAGQVINDPAATFTLRNTGIAAFVLEVSGVAVSDEVAKVLVHQLVRATSGGVRPMIQWATAAPAGVFRFDSGPGYDVGRYATAIDRNI